MASNKLSDLYHSAEHFLADMPIAKAIAGVISNPTPQEVGAQVSNLGSSASDTLQDATKDPMNAALNFAPMGMGTIIGKSAKGWATAEGKFSNMLDRQPRAEISDVGAKVNYGGVKAELESAQKYGEKSANVSLGFLLNHPELYKQYPELRGMRAYIGKTPAGTNALITNGADGKAYILINKDLATMPEAKQTLLHEIQHAIQEKEGFARGGSPENINPWAMPEIKNDSMVKSINKKMDDLSFSGYDYNSPEMQELVTLKENRVKSKLVEMYGENFGVQAYKRLGGEIESRSVAARSNIPQDQLKYSQPYGSEGIPLKEWIKAEDYLDK